MSKIKYPISKENVRARKQIRELVREAELSGHTPAFPIKVSFKPHSYMKDNYGTTELKGTGNKKYIEICLDEEYMKTQPGRDLCLVITIHELAHAFTWSGNQKVEESKTHKYGDHGPEFGFVYAQLWSDLMEGFDNRFNEK